MRVYVKPQPPSSALCIDVLTISLWMGLLEYSEERTPIKTVLNPLLKDFILQGTLKFFRRNWT